MGCDLGTSLAVPRLERTSCGPGVVCVWFVYDGGDHMSLVLCVYQSMWCCRCTVRGYTGSSSLSGLVIGVLSVSCFSELLHIHYR